MPLDEGLRRMRTLGKYIMFFGTIVAAGLAFWLQGALGLAISLNLVIDPLIAGAALWAAAWIVDGFMKEG